MDMGSNSICIKDMAGLLKPAPAYELVRAIKETCGRDVLVHVHTHATTGVTMVSLMKAIEAGADIVDTAISSAWRWDRGTTRPRRWWRCWRVRGTGRSWTWSG